jgi:hypothetical protein
MDSNFHFSDKPYKKFKDCFKGVILFRYHSLFYITEVDIRFGGIPTQTILILRLKYILTDNFYRIIIWLS